MRNHVHRSLHSAEETTPAILQATSGRAAPPGMRSFRDQFPNFSLFPPPASHCHLQGAHHYLTRPRHLQAAVRLLPPTQLDTPHANATPVLPHPPSLAKTAALAQVYTQCIIPATLQDSGARRGWGRHLHFHKLPQ